MKEEENSDLVCEEKTIDVKKFVGLDSLQGNKKNIFFEVRIDLINKDFIELRIFFVRGNLIHGL